MKKLTAAVVLVVGALFAVPHFLSACLLVSPHVSIQLPIDTSLFGQEKTCLSQDCQYVFEEESGGVWSIVDTNLTSDFRRVAILSKDTLQISREQFEPFSTQFANVLNSDKFFAALDTMFIGDQSSLRDPMYAEIAKWLLIQPTSSAATELRVTSYDAAQAQHLQKSRNAFFSCMYSEVTAKDGWMIVRPVLRDYCRVRTDLQSTCPILALSHVQHFIYQIDHLSLTGLPYLLLYIAFLLAIAGVISGIIYIFIRYKKRKKKKRSKKDVF